MQITSLEQLQAIKQTEIVELPSFEDGTPFEAEHYKAGKEEGLALIMPLLHDLEDKLPPQDISYSLQYLY